MNYLAFSRPENQHKTPLVLVGGAFQYFHSFISDIKAYLPHVPVILIALPGQSSKRDPRDASELSLKDLADLMEGLFQTLGLASVTLAGFSYGSVTAYTHAYYYEDRLDKLILVGCSLQLWHALHTPPVDCGGSLGYEELLEAREDPHHPSHAEALRSLTQSFDPQQFNLRQANAQIKENVGWK